MANKTFNYQQAVQAGYTPEAIANFLAQNPDVTVAQQPDQINQSSPAPQQSPLQQVGIPIGGQQQPQFNTQALPSPTPAPFNLKNFLLGALPTAGAIAGGLAGGALGIESGPGAIATAALGSGVGQAGGKALENKLEGKQIGKDVAGNAGIGALAGAGGEIVGPLLGKVLGKLGGSAADLAAKSAGEITAEQLPKVLDPVIPDSVNYATRLGQLTDTATEHGLTSGQPIDLLGKTKDALGQLSKEAAALPEMGKPFNIQLAQNDFLDTLQKEGIDPTDPTYQKAIQAHLKNLQTLGQGNGGAVMEGVGGVAGQPIVGDAYKLKANLSQTKTLSSAFKSLDMGTGLNPNQEIQLAGWSALKDSMDTQGGSAIAQINSQQNNLYDLGKAFAKQAPKNAPSFGISNIFPLAEAVSGHPLGAAAIGLGNKIASSPQGLGAISQVLNGTGKFAASQAGVSSATGLLSGGLGFLTTPLDNSLPPSFASSVTEGAQTQQNPSNDFNHGQSIQSSAQQSQPSIPTYDGRSTIPASLPDPNTIVNSVPGVKMTPQQYAQGVSSVGQLPLYLQANALTKLSADYQASQDAANQYLKTHALNDEQAAWMKNIPTTYDQMTQLHDLVAQYGANNAAEAAAAANPLLRTLQRNTDKTGNIALMDQLMQNLKVAATQDINNGQTGRYLTALQQIDPGNTKAANEKILENVMKQTATQYKQYAPAYGFVLQSPQELQQQNQSQSPASALPFLQQQQYQQPPEGFGRPAVAIPGQGGGYGKGGGGNSNPYQTLMGKIGQVAQQMTPGYVNTMENLPHVNSINNPTAGVMGNAAANAIGDVVNIPYNLLGGATRVGQQLGNGISGQPVNWQQAGQGAKQLGNAFLAGGAVQGITSGANRLMNIGLPSQPSSVEGLIQDAQGVWRDPLNGQYAQPRVVPNQQQLDDYFQTIPKGTPGHLLGGLVRATKVASRIH